MYNKLYDEYLANCELLEKHGLKTSDKKLKGAIVANLFKRNIEEIIRKHNLEDKVKISANNVYIAGSKNEYDLLIVKTEAEPILGFVYKAEDVIAVIESKGNGLYNLDMDTDNIASAVNNATKLNNKIKFGYITLTENVPVNEVNKYGQPTVKQWDETQRYLDDKIKASRAYYAVTLHRGKEIEAGPDNELEDFVHYLISDYCDNLFCTNRK